MNAGQAKAYPAGYVMEAPDRRGHFVRSRTVEDGWWLVNAQGCGCPAAKPGCWHYRQALAFEQRMHPTTPRPTAPVNISALVD